MTAADDAIINDALPPPTLEWADGMLRLVEQTLLPERFEYVDIRTPAELHAAIRRLAVRGAPAIGCAAAYGVVLAAMDWSDDHAEALRDRVGRVVDYLGASRPTAVNLFWALERMRETAERFLASTPEAPGLARRLAEALLAEAHAIRAADEAMCRAIGRHGAPLLLRRPGADPKRPVGVLTHCNAGSLATSRGGTALAPVYEAFGRGVDVRVYADETRPLLQGSRLTAWELARAGVPVTVLCDNMAAQAMREGVIDLVIVGADRIARNGDAANKIGTYGVAVLARHHGIPFYVAAPSSTFDPDCPDGAAIPIEQRDPDEVRRGFGRPTAPAEADIRNPAFDVTPAALITAYISETGLSGPIGGGAWEPPL